MEIFRRNEEHYRESLQEENLQERVHLADISNSRKDELHSAEVPLYVNSGETVRS